MKCITRYLLAAAFFITTLGCSHAERTRERCNPLGEPIGFHGEGGADCFLPYPSSFYTRPDASTATGVRLDFRDAALPRSIFGRGIDPAAYERRDGFSSVATLLAHFPERIDPAGLPGPEETRKAMKVESPVQLIDARTGERVPLFAELDANADPANEAQGLILQPVVRLRPKSRYIAVIRGLRVRGGGELRPLTGFRRLRDREVERGSRLEADQERYEEIFAKLERWGIPRASLQLAWDFTTGSDEALSGRLVKMRDRALASSPPGNSGSRIKVLSIDEHPEKLPGLARRVKATFTVPSYLEGGTGNRLALDANGEPRETGAAEFPLTIHVPECALKAKGPLPVMIYGHGTFNSAEKELTDASARGLANRLCMIQVGTDWLGRAKTDLSYFITRILPDWNNFQAVTDRLQQAHVNVAALARLVREGALDSLDALQLKGRPLADGKRIYYYGISEGGCQGVTSLALSPDIERGAMNVPCGFWSMFFWRSSDFYHWRWALRAMYPGALERQKLLALSQLLWDYTDPANYGGHLLKNPLPGNAPKRILYQEAINDASVPNLTTRAMARTIGLPQLGPGIERVEWIDQAEGPLDSAYVQYDVGVRPRLGANNVPPAQSEVHERVRGLEAVQEQLRAFFQPGGKVRDTCGTKGCIF